MKNIHILPTDKPNFGRYLVFNKENTLCIWDTELIGGQKTLTPHHIYITSDEEIKDGEYGLSRLGEIIKFHNGYDYRYYTKLSMTTDPELIADGVQAIDDEFLEWFVKNPSCEEVKVEKRYSDFTVDPVVGYKIIIPQEEPKQELLPDFKITKNIFDFVTDLSDTNKEEPKQDPTLENAKLALREHILANKEKVDGDLQEMRKKSGNGRYETLEEASEMFISKYYSGEGYERDIEEAIKFGAKWMEEEMEKLRDFETWKEWKHQTPES
jgi:hypothetical protein